ncbi:hypothetical protein [Winogradskyella forsetii]|uniref:hypothetical protein n=1 Tax=Winogradskyella forsetii TaxID=2686077 RepID=UPI0015B95F77|nr:hypothetical protein [Winogradskyella forsetii]
MNFITKLFGLNKKEKSEKDFDLNIKNFDSINSFWEFISEQDKWYLKYSPYRIKNIDKHLSELEPLIIQSTNQLRDKMEFSYDEYWKIINWDNLLINADMDETNKFKRDEKIKFRQLCSNCKVEKGFQQRYPKSICGSCHEKITDISGRKVEFFNTHWSGGGCQGYYIGTEQKEKYDSELCYINVKEYFAEEARFGGIVIQLKE